MSAPKSIHEIHRASGEYLTEVVIFPQDAEFSEMLAWIKNQHDITGYTDNGKTINGEHMFTVTRRYKRPFQEKMSEEDG